MSLASAAVSRLRDLSRKVFLKNLHANAARANYPAGLHARAAGPLLESLEPRVMLDAAPAISIGDVVVAEESGVAAFTISLSEASADTVTVNCATAGNQATSGTDFTAISTIVVFTPGVTELVITTAVLDDSVYEGTEDFYMNLSSPVNATIANAQGIAVIDDMADTPALSIDDVSDTEGAGFDFTVYLSNASMFTTTVDYATSGGTATAGSDYTSESGTLSFLPGDTSKTIAIATTNDALDEYDESFTVDLSGPYGVTIADAEGVGTIVDNDATPMLSIDDVTVDEAAGTAVFTVFLSSPSGKGITVDYATSDGTASAGADYTATTGTLTFATGETSKTISVPISDDLTYEGHETFSVNLSSPSNATIADAEGVGTILNNDAKPPVSFSITASPTVAEGGTLTYTVTPSRSPDVSTNVTVTASGGTATDGVDYSSGDATFSFNPGDTGSLTYTVNTVAEELIEGDETFNITLSNPTAGSVINPAAGEVTVTIVDPAPLEFSIAASPTVDEGDRITYTVTPSRAPVVSASVTVNAAGGTATDGVDYSSGDAIFSFNPGDTGSLFYGVNTEVDGVVEGDETFNITLSNPTGGRVSATNGSVEVTIVDVVPPTLSIGDVTVTEGDDANFTVSLSSASTSPVTVNFWTNPGTADAADYHPNYGESMMFAPGETSKTVTVPTVDDIYLEYEETFTVRISSGDATVTRADGTATILNDDPIPGFLITDDSEYEAFGGSDLIFNVTIPYTQESPVTVNYATSAGTATEGVDYTATSGTLTFAPGEVLKEIAVPILNDSLYEDDETLTLTLSNATGGVGIDDAAGIGTILNDDLRPLLTIDDAPAMSEQFGMGMFTLILSSPAGVVSTVDYMTVDGTATLSGADYIAKSGTVTFAAGETSKSISIAYLDDAIYEGTEKFGVALWNGSGLNIPVEFGLATILDDEGVPTISVSDVSLAEGDAGTTDFDFTVSLSGPSAQPITQFYETIGDASIMTTDLTFTNGTITFAPGETSKTVTVDVLGDTLIESDEQFGLAVTDNPPSRDPGTGDLNGPMVIGLGTILDDDEPTFSITGDTAVDEGDVANYTVSFAGNPTGSMTVQVATGAGAAVMADATEGVDYNSVDQTLTFLPGGPTSVSVAVTTVVDAIDEADEEFTVNLSNPSAGVIDSGADSVTTVIASNADEYGTLATAKDLGALPANGSKVFANMLNGVNERNDYVKVVAKRFVRLVGSLSQMTRSVKLQLLNAKGKVLATSAKGGARDQKVVKCVGAGTYYLRACRMTPGETNYRMKITGVPDRDRSTRETARDLGTITTLKRVTGSIGDTPDSTDRDDWYKFKVTKRGTVMVTLDGLSQNADLQLTNANGKVLGTSRKGGSWKEQITRTLRPGTYYLRVFGALTKPTDYSLSLKMM
jgi:hypothetical protein